MVCIRDKQYAGVLGSVGGGVHISEILWGITYWRCYPGNVRDLKLKAVDVLVLITIGRRVLDVNRMLQVLGDWKEEGFSGQVIIVGPGGYELPKGLEGATAVGEIAALRGVLAARGPSGL